MHKSQKAEIKQGILSQPSGEIDGFVLTKNGVIYLKPIKQTNKRRK